MDIQVPTYNKAWAAATDKAIHYLTRFRSHGPPADDNGDDMQAAVDNISWLYGMAVQASDPIVDYKQWWLDFIRSVTDDSVDDDSLQFPAGGCDGDVRNELVDTDIFDDMTDSQLKNIHVVIDP